MANYYDIKIWCIIKVVVYFVPAILIPKTKQKVGFFEAINKTSILNCTILKISMGDDLGQTLSFTIY
jgi:hypothetical protein